MQTITDYLTKPATENVKEAIKKADGCISSAPGAKPFPALYALKAYAYNKLGDTTKSRQLFEEFFQKVNPDHIGPTDYVTYAQVLLQTPGNNAKAESLVEKAIDLDTVPANKLGYVRDVAKSLYGQERFGDAGKWYTKILQLTPLYTAVDLYWAGYSEYRAGDYVAADSIFTLYETKFPNDMLGWYLGARAKEGIDTAQKGLAKPDYDMIIKLADTVQDKQSIKDKLIPAYRYMVAYYYNIKSDVEKAAFNNEKILELDPEDANAVKNKPLFESLIKKAKAGSGPKN